MVAFALDSGACGGAPTLLVLLLSLYALGVVAADGQEIHVKVHNMLHSEKISSKVYDPLIAGFNASIKNRTELKGVKVDVLYVKHMKDEEYIDYIKEQISTSDGKELPIILGPVGDKNVIDLIQHMEKKNVMSFSPFTGASEVRRWNRTLYFLSASPAGEMLALLRYAITQLRLKRLGFMYLKEVAYGDSEYLIATELMSGMGREFCGVFAVRSKLGVELEGNGFEEEWEKFAETRPQGVIVFGSPIPDTAKFLRKSLGDKRTKDAYILMPSMLQYVIRNKWSDKLTREKFVPNKTLLAGTNPLAKDSAYVAMRRFKEVMGRYLRDEAKKYNHSYNDDHFLQQDTDGELMVSGWIIGEVLSQALSSRVWLESREAFMKSLYNQRRYIIDDLVIGDFGGECEGLAGERGASCNCNQGGNVVYMKKMGEDRRLYPLEDGALTLTSTRCYRDLLQLYAPLSGIIVNQTDNPLAMRTGKAIYDGAFPVNGKGQLGHDDRFFLHWLSSTSSSAYKELRDLMRESDVTAVFGVVDETLLREGGVAFIDPVTLTPQLRNPRRNVIHLSPTLEQQLFVVVEHVVRPGSRKMCAIVRGRDGKGVKRMLAKTLKKFNSFLEVFAWLGSTWALEGYLPTRGDVLVAGLVREDIPTIVSHLEGHPDVRVVLPFFDVAVLYDELVSAFGSSPVSERVLFATSLPHWGEEETKSETVRRFHEVVQDRSLWKPLPLLGYATARAMGSVLARMGSVTPKDLIASIFSQSVITADDMRYGPFEDKCGGGASFEAVDCTVNYGATGISVWSMARALNASIQPVVEPVTPSMFFGENDKYRLTKGEIVGVVLGCIATIGMFYGVLFFFSYRASLNARDNNNAPKESTDPVTLIFTDIESSTAQWAAHPELMPDAVATHHRLIRSLIGRYGCYEVKTVGDSFMIACKSPFAAVQLACDLQRNFLDHDWKTTVLDDSYCEFERRRAEEDTEYTPPSAGLDPEVYHQLWNGLRVRVGIHTGLCDIRHDEVTKGYDYYGRTSNMAARTESVANGGQVLMTRSTYLSLSDWERGQVAVMPMGGVPLRGVPEPVEMYQVNAVPGRTFAGLRLDREIEDEEERNGSVTSGSSFIDFGLGEDAKQVCACMEALLGTFPVRQRQRVLTCFCDRWRIAAIPGVWDEATCRAVVRRIAVRVGRVVNFGERNRRGSAVSFEGAGSAASLRGPAVLLLSSSSSTCPEGGCSGARLIDVRT